jgi:EAL domain-containing protein (putative c-di-GMP-specific phosphodiesterase class I)
VAEGVESEDQLAFLSRESCDEVQGYLIGRPGPIENYAALIGRADPLPRATARAG